MQKKYFNKFDPFMPIKTTNKTSESIISDNKNELIDEYNKITLNESLRFTTSQIKTGFVIMLSKKSIGTTNEIGEKLLQDFIFALSNSFELPQYIILANEAVFLLDEEKVENLLFNVKKLGVKILVSIETLNFYDKKIKSDAVIQATSGDIAEKIIFSNKFISL